MSTTAPNAIEDQQSMEEALRKRAGQVSGSDTINDLSLVDYTSTAASFGKLAPSLLGLVSLNPAALLGSLAAVAISVYNWIAQNQELSELFKEVAVAIHALAPHLANDDVDDTSVHYLGHLSKLTATVLELENQKQSLKKQHRYLPLFGTTFSPSVYIAAIKEKLLFIGLWVGIQAKNQAANKDSQSSTSTAGGGGTGPESLEEGAVPAAPEEPGRVILTDALFETNIPKAIEGKLNKYSSIKRKGITIADMAKSFVNKTMKTEDLMGAAKEKIFTLSYDVPHKRSNLRYYDSVNDLACSKIRGAVVINSETVLSDDNLRMDIATIDASDLPSIMRLEFLNASDKTKWVDALNAHKTYITSQTAADAANSADPGGSSTKPATADSLIAVCMNDNMPNCIGVDPSEHLAHLDRLIKNNLLAVFTNVKDMIALEEKKRVLEGQPSKSEGIVTFFKRSISSKQRPESTKINESTLSDVNIKIAVLAATIKELEETGKKLEGQRIQTLFVQVLATVKQKQQQIIDNFLANLGISFPPPPPPPADATATTATTTSQAGGGGGGGREGGAYYRKSRTRKQRRRVSATHYKRSHTLRHHNERSSTRGARKWKSKIRKY